MARRKTLRKRRQRPRKKARRRTRESASPAHASPTSARVRRLTDRLQEEGATVVTDLMPGPKMSAMLIELAEAELEDLSTEERDERMEGTLTVAMLGWNAAVSCALTGEGLEDHLRHTLATSTLEPLVREQILHMACRAAIRKQRWFPDDHRFVYDAQFARKGDQANFNVFSVGVE